MCNVPCGLCGDYDECRLPARMLHQSELEEESSNKSWSPEINDSLNYVDEG